MTMTMYLKKGRLFLSLALLVMAWTLAAPSPVGASPRIRNTVKGISEDIKSILDERGKNDFRFGLIRPMPDTNPVPEIKRLMIQEFARLGVNYRTEADYAVAGEFKPFNDYKVELEIKILNPKDKTLRILSYQFDRDDIIPPEKTYVLKGTRVYDEKLKYGVEILVGNRGREPKLNRDMAFVGFTKGEIYAIRLINDSDYEAAVLLEIDGMNIFAFNQDPEPDGVPREYRVLVAKGKTVEVKGWYRKDGVSDSFRVAEYADTEAARMLRSPGDIGVITATFKAAWPTSDKPPPEEGRSLLMTDKGPPVLSPYVRVTRTLGENRATICIRYNRD